MPRPSVLVLAMFVCGASLGRSAAGPAQPPIVGISGCAATPSPSWVSCGHIRSPLTCSSIGLRALAWGHDHSKLRGGAAIGDGLPALSERARQNPRGSPVTASKALPTRSTRHLVPDLRSLKCLISQPDVRRNSESRSIRPCPRFARHSPRMVTWIGERCATRSNFSLPEGPGCCCRPGAIACTCSCPKRKSPN